MATAVTSVLSFALMIAVIISVLSGALKLTSDSAETQSATQRAAAEAALGLLSIIDAVVTHDAGATNVDITILNEGELSYSQFKDWNVNINYTNGSGDMVLTSLYYAETLADGTWSVEGLYMDAERSSPELIEPSVVNPGEYLVLRVRLGDGALSGTRGWAVVTPEDGISASVFFDA